MDKFVPDQPIWPDAVCSPKELEINDVYIFHYCVHDERGNCKPGSETITILGLPKNGKVKVKNETGAVSDRHLTDLGLIKMPAGWHHYTRLVRQN